MQPAEQSGDAEKQNRESHCQTCSRDVLSGEFLRNGNRSDGFHWLDGKRDAKSDTGENVGQTGEDQC